MNRTGLTPLGVVAMVVLVCMVLVAFSGCMGLPTGAADRWVHDGNYGFVTTHYEAGKVASQPDGTLKVGTYSGSVKVLGGYGVSDTVENLVVKPK